MSKIINNYNSFKGTLSEISYDKENKISLIEDEKKEHCMFNFDGISAKFCKHLRGEKNQSCDGYYIKTNEDTYLIEFKNQPEGNIDKVSLKNKIYDSIATLVMNENITREEVTKRTNVIIVYNDAEPMQKTNSSYNSSKDFNNFSNALSALCKKNGIDTYDKKFDLVKYKDRLFKDIFTIDKTIFEDQFIKFLFGK